MGSRMGRGLACISILVGSAVASAARTRIMLLIFTFGSGAAKPTEELQYHPQERQRRKSIIENHRNMLLIFTVGSGAARAKM